MQVVNADSFAYHQKQQYCRRFYNIKSARDCSVIAVAELRCLAALMTNTSTSRGGDYGAAGEQLKSGPIQPARNVRWNRRRGLNSKRHRSGPLKASRPTRGREASFRLPYLQRSSLCQRIAGRFVQTT